MLSWIDDTTPLSFLSSSVTAKATKDDQDLYGVVVFPKHFCAESAIFVDH